MGLYTFPRRKEPVDQRLDRAAALTALLSLSDHKPGARATGAGKAPTGSHTPTAAQDTKQNRNETVKGLLEADATESVPQTGSLLAKAADAAATLLSVVSRIVESDIDRSTKRRQNLAKLVGASDPLATAHLFQKEPPPPLNLKPEPRIEPLAWNQKLQDAYVKRRLQLAVFFASMAARITEPLKAEAALPPNQPPAPVGDERRGPPATAEEAARSSAPQATTRSAIDPDRAELIARLVEKQRKHPFAKTFNPKVAAERTEKLLEIAERIRPSDFELVQALMVTKNTDTLHIDLGLGKKELDAMAICLPFQCLARQDFARAGLIDLETMIGVMNEMPSIEGFGGAVLNANYCANIHPVPVGLKETGSTSQERLLSPYRLALTVSQAEFPDAVVALKLGRQELAWAQMLGPTITLDRLEGVRAKAATAAPKCPGDTNPSCNLPKTRTCDLN